MKKIVAVVAVLVGILSVMGGCKKDQPKDQPKGQVTNQAADQATVQVNDQAREDLVKYIGSVNKVIKPLAVTDKLTEDLAKAKTAKAYVAKLRNELLPLVTGALTQLEAIKPASKEVQDIHGPYLASFKNYAAGLKGMADAVEKNDDKSVGAAEVNINAFKPAHAKFINDSNELARKYNVKTE